MSLEGLPDNVTEIGSVHLSIIMGGEEGIGCSYGYDGVSLEAAIGYMTIVLDRMREEASARWDTCPGCGEAYDGDDLEDDDEEHPHDPDTR